MLRWVVLMRALSPIHLLPWCKKYNSNEGVSLYPQSHWAQPQEALIVVFYSLILLSSWWRFLAKKTSLQISHFTAIPGQKYSPKQVQSERVWLYLLLLLEQNRTCLRRQAARTCRLGALVQWKPGRVKWFSSHSSWTCFLLPWKIFCSCANQKENTCLKDGGICTLTLHAGSYTKKHGGFSSQGTKW